jgi:ribosomal protein L11 methyltransferase
VTDSLCSLGDLPAGREEALAELLAAEPVLGAHLEPSLGGRVRVSVSVRADLEGVAERVTALLARLGAIGLRRQAVERSDWLARYRSEVRAFPVGRRWWMDPHPDAPTPAPDGRLRLAVEPRMAFGTGSHESTQLLLLALEEVAAAKGETVRAALAGMTALDVGTGSGVLALAADRLGAAPVVGLDVDPEAIWVARQIRRQQDWPARPCYLVGPVTSLGAVRFDLVLCNMIPEQAAPLLYDLGRLLADHGRLLLSGLLADQVDEVRFELARVGLEVRVERRLGEWSSVWVAREAP